MKKYIKTKEDFIFEEIGDKRYKVTNMGAWKEIKIDFEYGTNSNRILKQADSIEELCDEFVLVNPSNNYQETYVDLDEVFDRVEDLELNIGIKSYDEARNLIYSNEHWNIYAAIWTDKGLIYIAKMNDKGKLELL